MPVNIISDCLSRLCSDIVPPSDTEHSYQSPYTRVVHLVNPQSATWLQLLYILQSIGLKFDIVKSEEWLYNMKQSTDLNNNPGIKLLEFYESTMLSSSSSKQVLFDTIDSIMLLPQLAFDNMNTEYWKLIINYWRDIKFLTK